MRGLWQRSPVLRGIGANVSFQAASTIAQLALVPVFAARWGVALYGVWLLLFTLPSYIVMADLGLASAAGNDITARVARGDRAGAVAIYQAVRVVGLVAGGVVVLIVGVTLYAVAPGLLDGLGRILGGDARPLAMALTLYGAIGLQTSVVNQAYRATGGYALFGYLNAGLVLAETLGALTLVLAGARPTGVAGWYVAARAVNSVALSLIVARRAPWLVALRWQSSARVLRPLLRPAAAMMALPGATAASIQGTVLVIGAVAGPAAVPAFTAVRTLSRVALQAVMVVNHAIMPAMTAAHATGDEARVGRYALASFAASLALALPGALALLIGGRWFVAVWTQGALSPGLPLLAVMGATMMLNAIWLPAANLILAINRHEGYSWLYLLLSLAAVALCVPLTRSLGTAGAGLTLLMVDAVMLVHIAVLSRRLGLFSWRGARAALAAGLRRRRGRRGDAAP